MTREEAKDVFLNRGFIEVENCRGRIFDADKWRESCRVISKWLEQEPCEDCVNRKELMDNYNGVETPVGYRKVVDLEVIKNMSSVTPTQRWIPVSERLPDTNDYVLCWYEYYHWSQEKVLPEYGLGCYLKETSAWFGEVANGKDVRVIAWMPLPEPYNAEMRGSEE